MVHPLDFDYNFKKGYNIINTVLLIFSLIINNFNKTQFRTVHKTPDVANIIGFSIISAPDDTSQQSI